MKIKVSFTPFMGIALADILANGVAMIILLIVITISTRHLVEQERLERVDEMTRVLSRDISTSVVMNNLASGPPAQLHDYHNSPNDRNLSHALMPILELRRGHIRNYYNGVRWGYRQLLLQDNALDAYLRTLSPAQRLAVRTDLYDVDMFYLYMSILKDHQIVPRHWHFAVDQGAPGSASASGQGDAPGLGDDDLMNALGLDGTALAGDDDNAEQDGDGQGMAFAGVPGAPGQGGPYPADALRYGAAREGDDGRGDGQQRRGPRIRQAGQGTMPPNAVTLNITTDGAGIFKAMMDYLQLLDERLRQGLSVVDQVTMMHQMLAQMAMAGGQPSEHQSQIIATMMREYRYFMQLPRPDDYGEMSVVPGTAAEGELYAGVITGDTLSGISLHGRDWQGQARLRINLQQYPEIFRGTSVELMPGSMVLAAQSDAERHYRWHPLFYVYPEFDDFVLGFWYGRKSEPGWLDIDAENNMLTLDGYSINRIRTPGQANRPLVWPFSLALLALLVLYWFWLRLRRYRSA